MPHRSWRPVVAACSLALAACGGGEDPPVPTTLEASTPRQQQAVVNSQVQSIPAVLLKDQRGQPMRNVWVRWRLTAGGGRLGNDSIRTDATGIATAGSWVTGIRAGDNTAEALVGSLPPVAFTVRATAGQPVRLVRASPDNQRATVNTPVAQPPAARALDEYDNPVSGVSVRFEVSNGGGAIPAGDVVTDTAGIATAPAWRLGTRVGPNGARASVPTGSVAATTFAAFATADVPVALRAETGDNQIGPAGARLPRALSVRVLDGFGNGVGGVPVTFTAAPNSGSLTLATAVTDSATGIAVAGDWILGTDSTQTVTARTPALPGSAVTFRARLGSAPRFRLDVRFVGGGSAVQRDAVTRAAQRWQEVIVGNVHTVEVDFGPTQCFGNPKVPAIRETITDVVIWADLDSIDGPGRVLARAGPCWIARSSQLPLIGLFQVDTADLALLQSQGTLADVITHEIGHILGIGTLWESRGLLVTGVDGAPPCTSTDDPYFTGTQARQRFAAAGGTTFYRGTPIPVENTGGGGTACGHWRRTQFRNELMQGFAQRGGMPLSAVTAGSLADMGYPVSFDRVDPFEFLPSLLATLQADDAARPRLPLGDDILDGDIHEVDARGRTRLWRRGTFRFR